MDRSAEIQKAPNPLLSKQHSRASKKAHETTTAAKSTAKRRSLPGVRPVAAKFPIGTEYGVRSDIWAAGHHTGIDYLAPLGTPVRNARVGKIVYIGKSGWYGSQYGLHVVVETEGVEALYAHLRHVRDALRVGTKIGRGDRIGLSGQSGYTFGPHLHFEVRNPNYRYGDDDFSPHVFLAAGWRDRHQG